MRSRLPFTSAQRAFGRGVVVAVICLMLFACGEEKRTAQSACEGLPTATEPPKDIAFFGALDRYTRERMCREWGRPDDVDDAGTREDWTYGNTRFVYDEDVNGLVDIR